MNLVISVERKPYSAVLVITLNSNLQYIRHKVILEGRNIFGLCRYDNSIAAISGHSAIAGTITIFDPATGNIQKTLRARPALDRRFDNEVVPIYGRIWDDVHEMKTFQNVFIIVNTISDSLTVVKTDNSYSYSVNLFAFCRNLEIEGAVYRRHSIESNYYHFNSIYIDHASQSFYVMGHNTRSPEGSFIVKGKIVTNNSSIDDTPILIPQLVIRDLSTDDSSNSGKQCHDLIKVGNKLFYSESVNSCISFINEKGIPEKFFQNKKFGYIRGLDIYKRKILFAGSSDFRTAAGRFQDAALELKDDVYAPTVLCIDWKSRQLRKTLDIDSLCKVRNLEIRNIVALQ